MLGGPSSLRRVVLSTVALSNESHRTSTASSPAWWRRWGHAESSSLSRSPPRCPAPSHSAAAFSSAGSGETCRGQLHCRRGWKEQFVLFRKGPEWKYIRGRLVCAQLRKGRRLNADGPQTGCWSHQQRGYSSQSTPVQTGHMLPSKPRRENQRRQQNAMSRKSAILRRTLFDPSTV